jgi:streptomycin 6-kinase
MLLPEPVEKKLAALGADGARWRSALPDLFNALERCWSIVHGPLLRGGSEALVVVADARDGTRAVLKLGIPGETSFDQEVRVLLAANGTGYARVLAHDLALRAVLLERLGPRLDQLDLSIEAQIAQICATLRVAWTVPVGALALMSGADKARSLGAFIASTWDELEQPCSERALQRALQFAQQRAAAHDPARAVLVHGDAHEANTLQAAAGFRFVDPDGLFAEPACDLAVPMRGWSAPLLAGDTIALGQARCRMLSDLTHAPGDAIWQWGFLERMSTGLYLTKLGITAEGRAMLRVADLWAVV